MVDSVGALQSTNDTDAATELDRLVLLQTDYSSPVNFQDRFADSWCVSLACFCGVLCEEIQSDLIILL